MRLVAQRPEAQSREDGAPLDEQRRGAEEGRGQKRVLAKPDIPPHRREGEQGDQRGAAIVVENTAGDREEKQQRRGLEGDAREQGGEARGRREERPVDRRGG